MQMKKILVFAICILAMVFSLASCGNEEIGSYLDHYDWEPTVIEDVELDLYIVVGEGTAENAMTTVQDKINQHLDSNYKTTLNIHYIPEADYAAEIARITATGSTENTGIVLINSKAMMDSLMASNSLIDVISALDTKDYGKLNTQINPSLLEAAIEDNNGKDAMYCIPNNHVIGEYEYIFINKNIAKDILNYSLTELSEMTTAEATQQLQNDAISNGYAVNDVVVFQSGDYAYRDEFKFTADPDANVVCNISSYPVTTKEEVYSSAFGILSGTENYNRAMQIIYAINTDVTLRNYLQYGVEHTNYTIENDLVVPVTSGESCYKMNILYTGDVFKALYCNTDGWANWTEEDHLNGNLQNDDADVPAVEDDADPDAGNTDSGNTDGGNTDGGNTDGGNTDGGNTDSDDADSGDTDNGNTDSGNTDSGNTDGGNS